MQMQNVFEKQWAALAIGLVDTPHYEEDWNRGGNSHSQAELSSGTV